MNKTNFKRVLLKISGESLMGVGSYGIDVSTVDRVAKKFSSLQIRVEICLVIERVIYLEDYLVQRQEWIELVQIIWVYGNCNEFTSYTKCFREISFQTKIQSAISMTEVCKTYTRRRAIRHMEKNKLLFLQQEQVILILRLIQPQPLEQVKWIGVFKGSKVDIVYDKDPKR